MNSRSLLRLVGKLLFKRRGIMPEMLTVFVTNRCPMRCRHCFYVKKMGRHLEEITAGQMEMLASSAGRIQIVILTGGEPLERSDLADLINLWSGPHRARVVALATSGYFPDRLERVLGEVFSRAADTQLDVGLSLDGPEEVHDQIRRRRGSYRRALESYAVLKAFRSLNAGLRIHLVLTFSSFNQRVAAESLLRWDRELEPDSLGVTLIRGEVPDPSAFEFDIDLYRETLEAVEGRSKFSAILEGNGIRLAKMGRAYSRVKGDLIIRTNLEKRRIMACYAGRLSAVIYPDGEVHACELLDSSLGNLRDFSYDLSRLLRSDKAWKQIQEISRSSCYCTHECNVTPNLLFSPYHITRVVLRYLSGTR